MQYNLHFHTCSCWRVLSIQPRGFIYRSGCNLCAHIGNRRLHCYFILLPTRGDKLGMCWWILCDEPLLSHLFMQKFINKWFKFLVWQVRNLLLTGCLFCGPLFLTFCFLNTVAIAYTATAALPFGTIVVIVLIWTLVTSPLLVLGGIAGKNSKAEFQAPFAPLSIPERFRLYLGTGQQSLKWQWLVFCRSVLYTLNCTTYLPVSGVTGFTPFTASCLSCFSFFW